jgi:DegV family protein with EDD domain
MSVAVVTDSTADLPAEACAAYGITVVPLTVVVNGVERLDATSADVAEALAARRGTVSTSRPTPESFASAYRQLLDDGADSVVSVHLSAALSGTYDAAVLAAADLGDAVCVVDGLSAGMGLGFAVMAAAEAAAAGGTAEAVREAALDAARRTDTFFYVDSLEHLRRGGRIGAASALLGTALSVKPILHVVNGVIVVREKVRTASRALARLADIAVAAAGDSDVRCAVHHLSSAQRAAGLSDALAARLGERLRERRVQETDPVVAAHVGPGFVGVVVHRLP